MFLQFTVNNFLSIKEKATFSMLDSSKEDKNSFSFLEKASLGGFIIIS